ncbi:MAG: DNA polymerase II [bacterium]
MTASLTADAFLLQSTYRIESGRAVVQLWGRLDDGRTFLVRDTRQVPHFWIPASDAPRALALGARIEPARSEAGRASAEGDPVVRVVVELPSQVPPLRSKLVAAGIRCFEADVRFALRPLIDRGIRSRLRISGVPRRPRADEAVEVVFEDPAIEALAASSLPAAARPTVLSIDIETDPRARRLLAVGLHGCGHSEVLLLTPPGYACPEIATAARDERRLLALFAERLRDLDPDVLTGWNVIDFDLAVLTRIAAAEGVPLALGRGPGDVRIRPARSFWDRATASIPGRVVLDGIHALKSSFVRMESYALDAVARSVLGQGKLVTGSDRAEEILRLFEEDRSRLVAYNLNDARLVLDILDRLALVDLAVERSLLTGMPLDRVGASIASFELLYLAEMARRGLAGPTLAVASDGEGGENVAADDEPRLDLDGPELPLDAPDAPGRGGWRDAPSARSPVRDAGAASARAAPMMLGGHVLEPRPGLYEFVVVFDFKSLYPSLMRTFQIDPLGFVPAAVEVDDPIVAPNGARFRRAPGILPALLDELFPRRERAKNERRPLEAQAIKILMNSFYGVLGTPACRFFNPEVANAITAFGRELLLWTKARIEALEHAVIYGDTDSLFVWLAGGAERTLDSARALELGEALRARLNADLAAHVADRYRVESKLDLEFDTLYRKLLLLPLRHGGGGARKRYAGWVEDSPAGSAAGRGRVEFTGMEAVRSDWTDLAKRVQHELYARLFEGRPVESFLRETVDELRAGRLDGELVYRKMLRKDAAAYTKTTPPHVAAARVSGAKPGAVVAYVVTSNGPEAIERRTSAIDHEHYVEKQIRPVAEPVLAVLGLDFDRAVGAQLELTLGPRGPNRRRR